MTFTSSRPFMPHQARTQRLAPSHALSLPVGQLVRLDPAPRRISQGVEDTASPFLWRIDESFDSAALRATISNITTGHQVALYARHLEDLIEVPGAGVNDAKFTLHLRVQVVFEDGDVRLEPVHHETNLGTHT